MPNGDDKVWVRTSQAIGGFREKHGHWPTILLIPTGESESLLQACYLFRLERLRELLRFVETDEIEICWSFPERIHVADEEGNRAEYPKDHAANWPWSDEFREWFGADI